MITQMWREPLRKLLDILESQDQYHQLLSGIDQTIAKTENLKPSDLFDEFGKAIDNLSVTLNSGSSALYIRNGQDGYILSINRGAFDWPSKLDMTNIHAHLGKCCDYPQHITNREIGQLGINVSEYTVGLISGVASSVGSNICGQFAVFIFLRTALDSDVVWEDEALDRLHTVCLQLSNGYRFAISEQRESVLKEMVIEFFKADMEPQKCLNAFSRICKNLFPSFNPLVIKGDIKTQLLLWDPAQPEFMSIRATTGEAEGRAEPIGSIVNVSESITGKLILSPEKSYYYCDPRLEAENYVPYLGRQMRSELAIPVQLTELCSSSGEKCRAIINFESEVESAFSDYHIDHITRHFQEGEVFQKMIDALLMQQRRAERGVNASFQTLRDYTGYWVHMFSHAVGNQHKPITDNLFALKRRLDRDKEPVLSDELTDYINNIISDVESSVAQLDRIYKEYCKFLIDVSQSDDRNVADLLTSAMSMWKADGLKAKKGIALTFENLATKQMTVHTSAMLSQHIYNLIDNSVYWIKNKKERLASLNEPEVDGVITIKLEELSPYLDSNKYQSRYCQISIIDNGEGASEFVLSKLRNGDKQFTTRRRGSGLGMFAMTQYVRSIGGTVAIESTEFQFFLVRITLPLSRG